MTYLFANKKRVNIRQVIKTRHEICLKFLPFENSSRISRTDEKYWQSIDVPNVRTERRFRRSARPHLGQFFYRRNTAAGSSTDYIRCNAVSIIATKRSTNNRIAVANAFVCFSFESYPRDFRTFPCPVTLYTSRSPFSP